MPSSTSYDSTTFNLATAAIDLATVTLKVMLVDSYTPSPTHQFRSDVSSAEVSGTGYTAGGNTLTGVTITKDTTNNWTLCTAADPSWSSATITATGAIVYVSTGNASTDELVSYNDFGGSISSTAGTFEITDFSTSGFLKVVKS
jgi:3D (Asp-Asp-Asp) domain-containing protein